MNFRSTRFHEKVNYKSLQNTEIHLQKKLRIKSIVYLQFGMKLHMKKSHDNLLIIQAIYVRTLVAKT